MQTPLYHVLDTVVALSVSVLYWAGGIVLAQVPTTPGVTAASANELIFLVLPLMGAILPMASMIALNPTPEARNIVFGRAGFALFLSAVLPGSFPIVFPSWAPLFAHPLILVLAGGVISWLAYALSLPLCRGAYARSGAIAKKTIDLAEQKLLGQVGDVVETRINGKFERAQTQAVDLASERAKDLIATAAPVAIAIVQKAADDAAKLANQQ